jgi:uncharacterized repeat protein (TIGR01451 family)
VRGEGQAELLGDLVLTCTGGTPTAGGALVPTTTFQITLNTGVADTQALLIVDEPHSPGNPNVPLLACSAAECSIIGDGAGKVTYNGVAGHPNVFPGPMSGANSISFPNVPLESPGANGVRTLRFTNLRGNISQLAGSAPNLVTATLTAGSIPQIVNATQTVAIWQTGLTAYASIAGVLTQCGSANTQTPPQFSVTLQENFGNAFRPKNIAQELANSPVNYPADQNQDIPGILYNSETGFFDGGSDPPPNALIPTIPTTADFPAADDLNQAGVAGQGTRVYVSFSNVPAGMTLYVPATLSLLTGWAVLVSTDAAGNGPFVPVTPTGTGLGAMQTNGTTALAVYEILDIPAGGESMTVPITATYATGALAGVSQQIAMQAGFAPFGASTSAPSFQLTPDFSQTAFLFRPCGQPDLTLSMSSPETGSFTLRVRNSGDAPTSAVVSVTDTLPVGLTATSLSGSGWNCTLSSVTCTRSDLLPAGGAYPSITLVVNFAPNAQATVTNTATVSGGGETLTANDGASYIVNVTPLQAIMVTTSIPSLTFIVDGLTYAGAQVFQWPTGSTHSVSTALEQNLLGTEYVFNQWSDGGAAAHTITVGAVPATYTASFAVQIPPLQCTAATAVPRTIRAEGEAELVNDLLLTCTGGTPTAAGLSVPQVSLTLTFNTTVTSHLPAAGFSEALLLVDEPHSNEAGSTNTLLPCIESVCAISGNGTGMGTYNGASGHPNVFQAQPQGTNAVLWTGVPLDPPGDANTRILRFTNLRVNATALNSSPVNATVAINPTGIAISAPQQSLASVASSLAEQSSGVAVLSQCIGANQSIAVNPASPLDTGGQNGAQFLIGQTEQFIGAFQVKNFAELQANAGPPITGLYAQDLNQDVPGYVYGTETGFFDGSVEPNGFAPSVEFPFNNGLNTVGSANSGTRVYFRFSQVPSGVQLFVPTTVPLSPSGSPGSQTGIAVLTSTDVNGAGAFSPILGNASGLAPIPISNDGGLAVYEILYSSPTFLESVTIPVAAAYLVNQALPGTLYVQSGLAPLSAVTLADSISPLPRFATLINSTAAFTIEACALGSGTSTTGSSVSTTYSPNAQNVALTATVMTTSGPLTGGTVTFTVPGVGTAGPVIVVNGAASANLTFSGTPAGVYPIQANFSGIPGEGIAASSDAMHTLTIAKVATSITWSTPNDILSTTRLSATQLNAVASQPGTLVYTPAAGALLSAGNNQTLQVTFTPSNSDYATSTKTVLINVKPALPPAPPFGSFDTPAATSNVSGSVGFTGWALAAAGIAKVDIWREQSSGLVYIGAASFVTGSRPDVQSRYPNYLDNGASGWGYLMLTNELPGANGTFQIHAIAHDVNNASTDLGTKTIVVDNADATQPFGSIDTPTQGGTESGTFVNFGWALTPPGKSIPVDGSTIWVFIDGVRIGHPVYDNYRSDIATLFPGYANSQGAVGYYYIDTTQLTNGLHTISWTVTDSAGVASGIGSRYFTVQN